MRPSTTRHRVGENIRVPTHDSWIAAEDAAIRTRYAEGAGACPEICSTRYPPFARSRSTMIAKMTVSASGSTAHVGSTALAPCVSLIQPMTGPEIAVEMLPDAPKSGRHVPHHRGCRLTEKIEAESRQWSGDCDEQRRRHGVRDAAEELPHHIHDAVHPDEQDDARVRGALRHFVEDVGVPLTRSELGRRRQPHRQPDDEEERPPHFAEHPGERDAGSGAFGRREGASCEHHRIGDGRHEHQEHLGLPAETDLGEPVGQQATDDDAAGKPGVKGDEARGLVVRIQGGDERVDERLDQPVGDADDEGGRKKRHEVRRKYREQDAADVACGGERGQPAHAERVDQRSAEQNREAKAPERGPGDPSDFDLAQTEHRFEIAHDVAADGERHGGGDERDAAGAEEMGRHGGRL